MNTFKTTVEVSARHIHFSQADYSELFGNEELTVRNSLSQPGEFASNKTVEIVGPEGRIQNIRVLGPLRDKSKLELSRTDCFVLGVDAPYSVQVENDAAKVKVVGEKGQIVRDIAIVPKRHWHLSSKLAEEIGVENNSLVSLHIVSESSVDFHQVVVRVSDKYLNHAHLNTDEGNAAGINKTCEAEIIIPRNNINESAKDFFERE